VHGGAEQQLSRGARLRCSPPERPTTVAFRFHSAPPWRTAVFVGKTLLAVCQTRYRRPHHRRATVTA